jgi:hypothetical protein
MAFENLPGVFNIKNDGAFSVVTPNDLPVTLVLGTANKGPSETLYRVDRSSDAIKVFGKTGTLCRGMYEVQNGGAQNINLFRIGATPAILANVGGGLTIETVSKDDSAGTDYTLWFNDTSDRLIVYRASDDEIVWDNNPSYPLEAIDLGEVAVTGTATGSNGDIGAEGSPITLAAADGVSGASYTAGTDGVGLSRMELYEALYNAYQLLSDQKVDFVVPMNVFLDDLNVMDISDADRTTKDLVSLAAYPSAGNPDDVLGKVYVEEYEGKNYFWWWFPSDIDADVDTTFTSDGGANIYPSAGSASATKKTDNTSLTGSDFHEVNFAYQLANFCYRQSNQNQEMVGFIGTLPPVSLAYKDISTWVGKLPVTSEDSSGNLVVTTNGSGLLGNRFMSGRIASGSTGIPGYSVGGVAAAAYGGFIATDDGWLDGAQQQDDNEAYIDLGKYLSIVPTYPILSNPINSAYRAPGYPTYAGLCSSLPAIEAPTLQVVPGVRLPYRINTTKLDLLAGQRYVTFSEKKKGIVVSDAPTAARPSSDYRRYSTVAIVKKQLDGVRTVCEPYLGKTMGDAIMASLDTAIDNKLAEGVKSQEITKPQKRIIQTKSMRILGQVIVELKFVPAFEIRQITVVLSLSAG